MSARSQPMEVGMAPATEDPRSSRYRDAERVLWSYYGIKPVERYIELRSFSARLRVLEVGRESQWSSFRARPARARCGGLS
jgi:hypothetical protein